MKKEYIMPEMSIARFSVENIVTVSSGMTAHDIIEGQMTGATGVYSDNWDTMEVVPSANSTLSIN